MTWQDKPANSLDYADKNYNAEQVACWLDGAGKFLFSVIASGKGIHDGTTNEFHARRGW